MPTLSRQGLALLRQGTSAGHAVPVRGARGGAVGSGGGSARPSPMGPFGDENERTRGGFIGPFSWGGDLTPGAEAARAQHAQFNENEQNALGAMQDEMAKGNSLGQALANVARSQPDALHALMLGGHLKDLAAFQQLVNPGSVGAKPYTLSPGAKRYDAQNNLVSENPIQPGTISVIGQDENGQPIYSRQGSKGQTPGLTFTPQNNTQVGADKANSVTDKNNASAANLAAKTADPYAGKPYKIGVQDATFLSVLPEILKDTEVLREFGKDANGLMAGPAQQLAAKALGTNDPAIVWNTARSNLERNLMEGKVPSAYAGAMKEFLGTLPKVWQNARYNTADLSQFASSLRARGTAVAANVEQENGGRPLNDTLRNQLREQGVIAPSYGQDNPIDALQNPQQMSREQLGWLAQHPHVLNPTQAAAAKSEIMRRAALETGGQPPATPAAQGQGQAQTPPGGPQNGPQGQPGPTSAAPTNADQQSQLPQQVQQAQSQMAPPGGVNPTSLQPDQAELQRQQQAQELISQSRALANGGAAAPIPQ